MNTGDTGFMLIASALVMFMTPGLAFFYFIGNSEFQNGKKKRMFIERTLDRVKMGALYQ